MCRSLQALQDDLWGEMEVESNGGGTKRGDPLALPQEEEDGIRQRSQFLLDLPPRASWLLRAAKTFINVRFPAKGQIAHI